MRHLMQDLRDLIPHGKSEPKLETKKSLTDINEICNEHNCNNCIFFEPHRHTDLYMWISRIPNGPACKFFVTNIHTMSELKLTGNCLKASRPLLIFDKKFEDSAHFKLIKEVFTQTFGTPYGHPNSKPFIDHVFSFMICDNKIWFRNYQIVFDADTSANVDNTKPNPVLVEIGPRFVLHPVKIQRGSFQGSVIYQDGNFINPNAERRAVKMQKQLIGAKNLVDSVEKEEASEYVQKQFQKFAKKERDHFNRFDFDPEKLDQAFDKGIFLEPKHSNKNNDHPQNAMEVDAKDESTGMDIDVDFEMELNDSAFPKVHNFFVDEDDEEEKEEQEQGKKKKKHKKLNNKLQKLSPTFWKSEIHVYMYVFFFKSPLPFSHLYITLQSIQNP